MNGWGVRVCVCVCVCMWTVQLLEQMAQACKKYKKQTNALRLLNSKFLSECKIFYVYLTWGMDNHLFSSHSRTSALLLHTSEAFKSSTACW